MPVSLSEAMITKHLKPFVIDEQFSSNLCIHEMVMEAKCGLTSVFMFCIAEKRSQSKSFWPCLGFSIAPLFSGHVKEAYVQGSKCIPYNALYVFAYVTKFALDCQQSSFIPGALQWMQMCLWWNGESSSPHWKKTSLWSSVYLIVYIHIYILLITNILWLSK